MTDVVDLIEQDHREVEQLFADYGSSKSPAVAERICNELTKHTFGEERAVYPVIAERLGDGKDLSDEAVEEHQEARRLIGRIRNTSDGATLAELMDQLEGAIRHHVREEESEMLPQAREQIPADDLETMARDFEDAKESAARRSS